MADHPDRSTHLATLFEPITGRSTLTEQQIEIPVRSDDHTQKTAIADSLDTTTQGFEDGTEERETY